MVQILATENKFEGGQIESKLKFLIPNFENFLDFNDLDLKTNFRNRK